MSVSVLNDEVVRDLATVHDLPTPVADGYYIAERTSRSEVRILAGPFASRDYAIHRAITRYGMTPPDGWHAGSSGSL